MARGVVLARVHYFLDWYVDTGHLRAGQGFWPISHAIYLVRDQHLQAPLPSCLPTSALLLLPILVIPVIILIRAIRLGTPGLSALPEIVVGLFIGVVLWPTHWKRQTIGSVTDFLGDSLGRHLQRGRHRH